MTTMTATDARKHFFEMLKTAMQPGTPVTITHEGLPKVVVMSVEEFEGWQETLDIMSDPELVATIQEGMASVQSGEQEDAVDLDGLKKELNL